MKKISITLLSLIVATMLSACEEQQLAQGETYSALIDIPVPANKGAIEAEAKEKEENETKASHDYDTSKLNNDNNTIVIGEKLYLTQIDDIYNNFQRYVDKTIVVEGMLGNFTEWDDSFSNPVVFRNGPGCCGNDGWGGFFLSDMEVKANGESYLYSYKGEEDIELDDWIKVTGKPELYQGTDTEGTKKYYLFLAVDKIENFKDNHRGADYVPN